MMAFPSLLPLAFEPPGPRDFELPPIVDGVPWLAWLTKPVLVAVLSVPAITVFFAVASRRRALVPGRLQFAAELAYDFVRTRIARDAIGSASLRYLPFLAALFFFILVNNVVGTVPLVQFPTFSHVGWAFAAAGLAWIVYNAAGIRAYAARGPRGRLLAPVRYLRHQSVPADVPVWLYPVLVPLEFLSNIVARPISLSLRLFANMFAGHLLVGVFALGGAYLVGRTDSLADVPGALAGILTWLLGLGVGGLELFVQVIQAFVFTSLTARYIGMAIEETH